MDLVVDANILFASLIKDNASYRLFFNEKLHLFAPEYIFSELEEHKAEILEKTEKTIEEFDNALDILKKRIILVPLEELREFIQKAELISPDPDDMAYFALALKIKCAIWSNDKKLKEQNTIEVYHTHELVGI